MVPGDPGKSPTPRASLRTRRNHTLTVRESADKSSAGRTVDQENCNNRAGDVMLDIEFAGSGSQQMRGHWASRPPSSVAGFPAEFARCGATGGRPTDIANFVDFGSTGFFRTGVLRQSSDGCSAGGWRKGALFLLTIAERVGDIFHSIVTGKEAGRQILMRAQDGQGPRNIFLWGSDFPVTLSLLSTKPGRNDGGARQVSSTVFARTDFCGGKKTPVAVVNAKISTTIACWDLAVGEPGGPARFQFCFNNDNGKFTVPAGFTDRTGRLTSSCLRPIGCQNFSPDGRDAPGCSRQIWWVANSGSNTVECAVGQRRIFDGTFTEAGWFAVCGRK